MAGRLIGKRAVVTGAAQGIGAEIVRAMRREGADVFAVDVDLAGVTTLAAECGANAVRLDVTSEADWQELATLLKASGDGRLSILVHNAGIDKLAPLADTHLADWRRVMAVNLDGLYIGCRTMQPLLAAAGSPDSRASVVIVSSGAGLIGMSDRSAYCASKAGARHLSKSLAIEWATHGLNIRSNSVHPGAIRTPMLEIAARKEAEAGRYPADSVYSAIAALAPLNQLGKPADIAMGVVYLASDEANFVTGTELVIDGGINAQ